MLTYIAIISLISILYAYFGYPAILYFFDQTTDIENTYETEKKPSSLSIVIATRNEEKSIKEKIENTLSLSFGETTVADEVKKENSRVQIIIADDCSDDLTHQQVKDIGVGAIEFISLAERGGKERAQKNALLYAKGEIIIFTDAKVILSDSSLNAFLHYFSDPAVGAVSSIDSVIDESGKSGESAYVRYEMKIREMESRVSTLVGLSGSCFAVRKEVALDIPEDIPSDFALLLSSVKQGLRGRHAPEVIAYYKAVHNPEKEFQRKVRTVLRGMRALFSNTDFLKPSQYGFFSFQLISHKLYRWSVPVFFILLFISSYALSCSFFWKSVWFAQCVLLLLAAFAYLVPAYRDKIYCKIPLFLVISNSAIMIAWIKLIKGEHMAFWTPSDKG